MLFEIATTLMIGLAFSIWLWRAAPKSADTKSFAVIWLEENTAAGTRLLVPPELVDDFTAGLPGRQVLPNDDTAVRNGDRPDDEPEDGQPGEGQEPERGPP